MKRVLRLTIWSVALTVALSTAGIGSALASGTRDATSTGLSKAQAYLKPYLKEPTKIPITAPLNGNLKGKTVVFVECGVANCKEIGDILEEPMRLLGANFERVPAGITPADFAAGFDRAVQIHPSVVVTAGIDASFVSQQLDQLQQMHIPAILTAVGSPPSHGVFEFLGPAWWTNQGRAMAAWIAVHSKGAGKVLYLNESVFSFAKPERAGFEAGMRDFCPKCTVQILGATAADVGTTIPGQVVSKLQQSPDINYIAGSYGALTIGVASALREAHGPSTISIVNQTGVAPNLIDLKQGRASVDFQNSPLLSSWVTADIVARAALGQKQVIDLVAPLTTALTAKDVTFDPNSGVFEGVKNLKQQFKSVWGIH